MGKNLLRLLPMGYCYDQRAIASEIQRICKACQSWSLLVAVHGTDVPLDGL
jgi:hypothetical protein